MFVLKNISHIDEYKKYLFFILLIFFMNNFLGAKSEENSYLFGSGNQEDELEELYRQNSISFGNYDQVSSQFKLFFGYNLEPPNNSYYPDLSIIESSDYIRNMYTLKLNDMTINKIIYNIKK